MIYKITFSDDAEEEIKNFKRHEPRVYLKIQKLLLELQEHPRTGTGHPEPLSGDRPGQWSRRITGKHRLIYEIIDDLVKILVLSVYGHYRDK